MDLNHLSQDSLLRYLDRRMTEEESENCQGHVAFCDSCAQRLDALMHIRQNLESSWTVLEETFMDLPVPDLSFERRVGVSFDLAFRVFFDLTRNLVTLGTAGVEALARPLEGLSVTLEPHVAGVASPAALDAERHRTKAGQMMDAGRIEDAVGELLAAEQSWPGASRVSEMRIVAGGADIGRLIADSQRRSVHVIVWPTKGGQWGRAGSGEVEPEAVLLTSDGDVLENRRLAPVEGAPYWMTRFENVDVSQIVVAVRLGFSLP